MSLENSSSLGVQVCVYVEDVIIEKDVRTHDTSQIKLSFSLCARPVGDWSELYHSTSGWTRLSGEV